MLVNEGFTIPINRREFETFKALRLPAPGPALLREASFLVSRFSHEELGINPRADAVSAPASFFERISPQSGHAYGCYIAAQEMLHFSVRGFFSKSHGFSNITEFFRTIKYGRVIVNVDAIEDSSTVVNVVAHEVGHEVGVRFHSDYSERFANSFGRLFRKYLVAHGEELGARLSRHRAYNKAEERRLEAVQR